MKASLFGLLLLPLALPAHADEQMRKLAATLTNFTNQKLTEPGSPSWLKRTRVQFGVAGEQPAWMINTLHPVRQSREETLFLQGRLRQEDGSLVSNIGSGYRWRTAGDRWTLGLNGFYDQEVNSSAERFSIGGEAFGRNTSLRANLYNAIDGHADPSGHLALDGFDIKLETPAPLLRQTRLSLEAYQWNPLSHITSMQGWSAALKTRPGHRLSMELGAGRSTRDETALFVNLTYHFGNRSKPAPSATDRLSPQHTRIAREYNLQAGNG
ncbi:MAG: inverse autotransporter beta domain-containing protein [Sulfuricella denitrificans]|nr:inverse autotransporter beta domain-containing protein [Sulfuricella denitrificans]